MGCRIPPKRIVSPLSLLSDQTKNRKKTILNQHINKKIFIMNQNLKLFTLLAFISLFGLSAMAQDIIVLKNGDEIKSIVREVEDDFVLYKKWEDQTDYLIYLKKDEVFMIKYQNGTKVVFNEVAKPSEPKPEQPKQTPTTTPYQQSDVQLKMKEVYWKGGKLKYSATRHKVDNPESLFYGMTEVTKNYRSGKTLYNVGSSVSGFGSAIMCYGIIDAMIRPIYYIWTSPIFWSGFGVGAVGGILAGIGSSKIKTAVEIYNASIRRQQTAVLSLNLGITQSGGVGFMLNY